MKKTLLLFLLVSVVTPALWGQAVILKTTKTTKQTIVPTQVLEQTRTFIAENGYRPRQLTHIPRSQLTSAQQKEQLLASRINIILQRETLHGTPEYEKLATLVRANPSLRWENNFPSEELVPRVQAFIKEQGRFPKLTSASGSSSPLTPEQVYENMLRARFNYILEAYRKGRPIDMQQRADLLALYEQFRPTSATQAKQVKITLQEWIKVRGGHRPRAIIHDENGQYVPRSQLSPAELEEVRLISTARTLMERLHNPQKYADQIADLMQVKEMLKLPIYVPGEE